MPDNKTINAALAFVGKKLDDLKATFQNQKIQIDVGDEFGKKAAKALSDTFREKEIKVEQNVDFRPVIDSMLKLERAINGKDNKDIVQELTMLNKSMSELELVVPGVDFAPLTKWLERVEKAIKAQPQIKVPDYSKELQLMQKTLERIEKKKLEIPDRITLDDSQFRTLSQSGSGGSMGGTLAARNFTVSVVTMTTADTEYSHTFSANTSSFFIKVRSQSVKLLLASATGTLPTSGDGSAYFTVPQNGWMSPENLDVGGKTIYLQTASASQTAEIMEFRA